MLKIIKMNLEVIFIRLTPFKVFIRLLFFLFPPLNALSLPLDFILKTQTTTELKNYIEQERNKSFLIELCKKQKEKEKIPIACYQLGEKADPWCLKLKLEDLRQLSGIQTALKLPFLSPNCKNYLKSREKILKYREKDFFLPELKKYFTVQKPFF